MLEFALQYAARGWKIFPLHSMRQADAGAACTCGRKCESPGKHPRTKHGLKDATTDRATIERWWTRWPDANIGLATGAGLVVVDVDGPEGVAELQAAQASAGRAFARRQTAVNGLLARTLTAQTGGGFHLYYQGELKSSARGKVHVRGPGGYVVAPPSLHASGRRYTWIEQAPIAPLPDWLRDWLQTSQVTQVTAGQSQLTFMSTPGSEGIPAHIAERHERLQAAGLPNISAKALKSFETQWNGDEETRIRSALVAIPASCGREPWLHIGMALHSLNWQRPDGSDAGFDIWLEWSSTGGPKFQGEFDLETRWNSFGKSGRHDIGLGTLFHIAGEHGWKGNSIELPLAPKVESGSATVLPPGAVNGTTLALPAELTKRTIHFPDTDKHGTPKPTCINARKALAYLELDCRYDTFHERLLVGGQVMRQWSGELSDNTTQMLRVLIYREFGFDPGLQHAHDAAVQECLQAPFDPVVNYLNDVEWDGRARLDTWLQVYLGAEDTALARTISRLSLVAAVRRSLVPGTKFDQIVVLESPEGQGKSSAIEILAGADNFSDQPILTLDDRGQQEAVQGVWLYEIADLAGMARTEVERIKAFASRRVDRARPAYGRSRVDKARRCIFFASTNDETYLKSQTGNRRFWPVRVGRIDLAGLKRDRDQLWAEAVASEHATGSIMLPEGLWNEARATQEDRLEQDPWVEILAHVQGKAIDSVRGAVQQISTKELLELHLRLAADRMHQGVLKRVAMAMARLGWRKVQLWRDGQAIKGYERGGF